MDSALIKFQKYLNSYLKNYSDKAYDEREFIDDMLYGLGEAVSEEFKYRFGFNKFKTKLYDLIKSDLVEPCPHCGQSDRLEQHYWPGCSADFFSIYCDRDECEEFSDNNGMEFVEESDYERGLEQSLLEWNKWARSQNYTIS